MKRLSALIATLTLGMPAAHAAPTVYVDGPGNCSGNLPCYDFIQDGVNNSGPGTSTVHVFPGTYEESVNLSTTGASGSLTLRTWGNPGTVLVSPPAAGESFYNANPLTLNLVFDGFDITSPTTDAMDLEDITGSVDIIDLKATNAVFDGVDIRASGDVTLLRSEASSNRNDGFQITITGRGDLEVIESKANSNGGSGDGDDGFDIELNGGSLTVTDVEANGNAEDGIDYSPLDGGDGVEMITITRSEANDNGAAVGGLAEPCAGSKQSCDGFDIGNRSHPMGDVTIIDSEGSRNYGSGFEVSGPTDGNITVRNSRAEHNAHDGFQLDPGSRVDGKSSVVHQTIISNSHAFQNGVDPANPDNVTEFGGDGFALESCDSDQRRDKVRLEGVTANENTDDGIEVHASEIVAIDVTANGNGFDEESGRDGIQFEDESSQCDFPLTYVNARNITANDNANDGIQIKASGLVILANITANNNGDDATGSYDGIDIDNNSGDVFIRNCIANENADDGVDITTPDDVYVENCTASDNGEDGLDNDPGDDFSTSLVIRGALTERNGDDGIDVASSGDLTLESVCANDQDDDGIVVKLVDGLMSIFNSDTTGNGVDSDDTGDGIDLQELQGGPFTIASTNISGNENGVVNDSGFPGGTLVEASQNWWGAASGPTHPNNGSGTGDTVIDQANGGKGTVQYAGFTSVPVSGAFERCVAMPETEIPTLSEWARILLALLIGTMVLLVMRRRKRRS